MYLKSLSLTNFRNYQSIKFDFNKVNIILGKNTAGKTNLLEAIYFLSSGNPFKLHYQNQKDLINKKSTLARVKGVVSTKNRILEMIVLLEIKDEFSCEKKTIINKKNKKTSEFIGNLKVISFLPGDISLINSSPADRRYYFDHLIFQIDRIYYQTIIYLDKVILARNKLLEQIKNNQAKEKEILFWDKELIKKSIYIFYKRQKVINFLNKIIQKIYQKLTLTNNQLFLYYQPFLSLPKDKKEAENKYQKELLKIRNKEIKSTCSLLGPHRDDYIFQINQNKLASFGSRSEFRETILALKISESKLIEKVYGERPILILDDISSELDQQNKNYLFDFLNKYIISNSQVFMTTTSLEQINQDFLNQAKIFKLEKGKYVY